MIPVEVLRKYWGFTSFRHPQDDVINAVLSGRDTLAVLPTGGGKSICYQVPALCREGMCIVITPLIALMQDQVKQLHDRQIPALAIYSGMSYKEIHATLSKASRGACKLLYVSPERLGTAVFLEYLAELDINLIAVDEAHCISQWGYDFRPAYLEIHNLRRKKPQVPVLAVTASATPEVQADITSRLEMRSTAHICGSFSRPELSYAVLPVQAATQKLIHILNKVSGSAIVYCKTRKQTVEISKQLRLAGIESDAYHAGLNQDTRKVRQQKWISNACRVIVSTNAFGMGIDKPDVRLVVHTGAPDCVENYYQEAGRAGRDGKRSYAVLLVSPAEKHNLLALPGIRFPDLETIRTVYATLTNYLQVPVGTGEETAYSFELNDFVKKFHLDIHKVIYSLQALEQESVIRFQENLFTPSTICFLAGKEQIESFEQANPALEPLVKSLLRSYGGILDHPVAVSEWQLARLNRKHIDQIRQELGILHDFRLIAYKPRLEQPQIRFTGERVRASDLRINMVAYEKRKDAFIRRLQVMTAYLETDQCRAVFLAAYFGDKELKPCGICDNCLRKKKKPLSHTEFESLRLQIRDRLNQEPLSVTELLESLRNVRRDQVWQLLREWESENIIRLDEEGKIRLV